MQGLLAKSKVRTTEVRLRIKASQRVNVLWPDARAD